MSQPMCTAVQTGAQINFGDLTHELWPIKPLTLNFSTTRHEKTQNYRRKYSAVNTYLTLISMAKDKNELVLES